jgi:hypothetical protein
MNAATQWRARAVRRLAALLFCALAAVRAGGDAAAQGVVLVTDVSGAAALERGGPAAMSILSEIPGEARVRLGPGAQLVVLVLRSGDEYRFQGPAVVRFGAEGPQVLEGAPAERRANPLAKGGKDIAIQPARLARPTYVMRGARQTARIQLESPAGTRILGTAPEFRWRALGPGTRYRFELIDEAGRSLYESEGEETSLRLPSTVPLREGVGYTWEVSTRARDRTRYVSSSDFSVASAELRAQVEALRPATGAPVSERVAFAAWLEERELREEARQYWKALAAERPGDARLRSLAAEK